MRYSDDLIEEIRMKNDIVDVISGYVYDAGDIPCDVSRVTTKAPCEVPAIHGSHVCKGITTSVLHAFSLQLFTVALIESCIFCKFVICCLCTMIHTTRGGIV